MAGERNLPGAGLVGFWDFGSDNWAAQMDENLRLLSVLVGASVVSRSTSLPSQGDIGDIYIVPDDVTNDAGDVGDVAIWDGPSGSESWVYLTPQAGWSFYVEDTGTNVQWDGSAWVEYAAAGGSEGSGGSDGSGGIADAPADGKYYARRNNLWASFIPGSGGSEGGGSNISTPKVLPIRNGDFEETPDLIGWTITKGSPTSGDADNNGFPVPSPSGSRYLKHANQDSQDYEVEQSFEVSMPDGGALSVRGLAIQTGDSKDLPYIECEFFDAQGNSIEDSQRTYFKGSEAAVFFDFNAIFFIPQNTNSLKFRLGTKYTSGSITNGGFDKISAWYSQIIAPGYETAKFTGLVDTPSDYSNSGGKVLSVKPDGSGIEFTEIQTQGGGGGGATGTLIETISSGRAFAVDDAGKTIRVDSDSAVTLTVPNNATAEIPMGSVITVRKVGSGNVVFEGEDQVTINALGTTLSQQYQIATLQKVAENVWDAAGALE